MASDARKRKLAAIPWRSASAPPTPSWASPGARPLQRTAAPPEEILDPRLQPSQLPAPPAPNLPTRARELPNPPTTKFTKPRPNAENRKLALLRQGSKLSRQRKLVKRFVTSKCILSPRKLILSPRKLILSPRRLILPPLVTSTMDFAAPCHLENCCCHLKVDFVTSKIDFATPRHFDN